MATYDFIFDGLGLRGWCGEKTNTTMSMEDLLAARSGETTSLWNTPFPSLDNLHDACPAIAQTRGLTGGLENGFLAIKDSLKVVLDPITQPLSWFLNGALSMFQTVPWWIMIPALLAVVFVASKSWRLVGLVASFICFWRSSITTSTPCKRWRLSLCAR